MTCRVGMSHARLHGTISGMGTSWTGGMGRWQVFEHYLATCARMRLQQRTGGKCAESSDIQVMFANVSCIR